jgi:hypothetical protein
MYTLYMLQGLVPFVGGLCLDNYLRRHGEFCNIRDYPAAVIKYDKQDPKDGCYRDGIFYPRCKDLDNPDVVYYHNLFKNAK